MIFDELVTLEDQKKELVAESKQIVIDMNPKKAKAVRFLEAALSAGVESQRVDQEAQSQ